MLDFNVSNRQANSTWWSFFTDGGWRSKTLSLQSDPWPSRVWDALSIYSVVEKLNMSNRQASVLGGLSKTRTIRPESHSESRRAASAPERPRRYRSAAADHRNEIRLPERSTIQTLQKIYYHPIPGQSNGLPLLTDSLLYSQSPRNRNIISEAKQAKAAFLHGPTVWKSPIVGIEPATFCSESAALTTAPRDLIFDKVCLQADIQKIDIEVFSWNSGREWLSSNKKSPLSS